MRTSLVPSAGAPDPSLAALRAEVRAFLREQIDAGVFTPGVDTWLARWNTDFTKALAARGWVGMTIPTEYGGHGRTFMERFVVTEELLAVGAPVAAQWVADRQAAPSLLKYGTEEQKRRFLPGIARGEICWAIGMSEPESGSDLASVKTRAVEVDGGWRITGTKLWTSGAHHADAFFALARSAPLDPAHRHAGLSQFIVLLDSPGVEIRPVLSMSGEHHFNEVVLDDVFVPDDLVLGTVGDGWAQVTSELGYERSGPERFMSTFGVLAGAVDEAGAGRLPADPRIGAFVGRIFGLHHMSRGVSGHCSGTRTRRSPRRWSRCSAPRPRATSPTSPTNWPTRATPPGRGSPNWSEPASCSVPDSPSEAARVRFCAGSSRGDWGCADE